MLQRRKGFGGSPRGGPGPGADVEQGFRGEVWPDLGERVGELPSLRKLPRPIRLADRAVEIAGMAMATDFRSTFDDKSCIKLVGYDMTRKAALKAYEESGLGPFTRTLSPAKEGFS